MSKVICDVCGTTYPETAAQCPICGSAKNSSGQTAAGTGSETEAASSGYAYVKGGRFSKKNVRNRSKHGTTAQRRSTGSARTAQQSEEPNNTGLVIVVILLLAAIVAVLIYIGTQFFKSNDEKPSNTPSGNQSTEQPSESTGQPQQTQIPCESIQLSMTVIELDAEGAFEQILVQLSPVDTTDEVTFESTDPTVATVSANGTVTAVGGGGTVIIVKCGDVTANCVVSCTFGEIDPGDDPTPVFEFEFNTRYKDATTGFGDVSLKVGESWKAYKSSLTVDVKEITWTSDDPNVATIENGVVTAVGKGTTKVYAQYNGITYTCIIRVK